MRSLLVLAVAAVAVPAASAGGWATVGSLAPAAGLEPTRAGPSTSPCSSTARAPLAGVTPVVRVRDDGGQVVRSFTAAPTGETGVYRAVSRSRRGHVLVRGLRRLHRATGARRRTRSNRSRSSVPTVGPVRAARARARPRARTRGSRPSSAAAPAAEAAADSPARRPHGGAASSSSRRSSPHSGSRPPPTPAAWPRSGSARSKGQHTAGRPWVVTVRVLQHGRTPMRTEPAVRIRNAAGKLFTFEASRRDASVRTALGSSFRRPGAIRSASTTGSPSPSAHGCTPSSRS